ncbi:MAG: hypothetical protein FWH26_11480 [Oscillospiraceae bacterium]|nr:hypothetical protein [Oscillospiraceae bacterium]
MKKNQTLRCAAALLVLCIFTLSLATGAMASYRAEAKIPGVKARVAAFRVLVNGKDVVTGDVDPDTGKVQLNVPLYSNELLDLYEENFLKVENTDNTYHVKATSHYTGVHAVDNAIPVIAPGTGGKIEFLVENLSEVPITYEITFGNTKNPTFQSNGIPVVFSQDKATWNDSFGGLGQKFEGIVAANSDNSADLANEGTLYWKWMYGSSESLTDTTNVTDSNLGITARSAPVKLTLPLTISVEQID